MRRKNNSMHSMRISDLKLEFFHCAGPILTVLHMRSAFSSVVLGSNRRLLMVGLAEAAASKTMVRHFKGIRGAFVVEKIISGKNRVMVQLEGSCFETVWQLKEGGDGGILDLNQVRCFQYDIQTSQHFPGWNGVTVD